MVDEVQPEYTQTLPDTEAINSQKWDFSQTFNYGWGTLLPFTNGGNLKITVLTEDCYSIGRAPQCSICLTADKIKPGFWQKISKVHFKLMRSSLDDTTNVVYLEDLSANGTYINGIKVGKKQRVILTSSDEISLATPSFKVFIYIDTRKGVDHWLSEDLVASFLVLRHLGTGGFGDVKLVIDKKTFQKYAMKKVENTQDRKRSIFNEVNILKRLEHPCIIRFEDIFESPNAVFITLEFMSGGNLQQRINTKKRIPESEVKLIFYQLILGVKYLHEEGIVHRDLKPENVLLEMTGQRNDIVVVKITDFGLSKIFHSATNLRTACGTLRYSAPEIIRVTDGNYDWKVDTWSLGVILFYCLSGELPFITCSTPDELARAILRGAYYMNPHLWQLTSKNAAKLVKHMLSVKPVERINDRDMVNHVWFQDDVFKTRIHESFGDKFLQNNESNESLLDLLDYNSEPKRLRLD